MGVQVEYKENQNLILTIDLEGKDYKPEVEKEMKAYAKRVNVPGFRQGQAPVGIVKRMAGKSIVMDTVVNLISDKLTAYLEVEGLNILGKPLPLGLLSEDDFDSDCNQPVSFSFEVGLAPEFDLNLNLVEPLTHYMVEVDDETLENEITDLRKRYGQYETPDVAEEGDWIFGKLQETDLNGEVVESGFSTSLMLNPERLKDATIFTPLHGLKLEDSASLDLNKLTDEEINQIASVTKVAAEDLKNFCGKPNRFVIKRITRTTLAVLDQKLFETLFGEDVVKDETEFREKLRAEIAAIFAKKASNRFAFKAQKALIAAHNFEMPDEFLKRWILSEESMREKKQGEKIEEITADNIDYYYAKHGDGFRWEMIEAKIMELHPEIVPTMEQIHAHIRESIDEISRTKQHIPDQNAVFNNLVKNQDYLKREFETLKEENILNFIEKTVPHEHRTITSTEFNALKEE